MSENNYKGKEDVMGEEKTKRNKLPESCFALLPGEGKLIILKKGETGYYPSDWETGNKWENQYIANWHNALSGISPAQVTAMQIGSMAGFDAPGANPQIYFDKAQLFQTDRLEPHGMINDEAVPICGAVQGNLYHYNIAGGECCYLEASSLPDTMLGTQSNIIFLLDLVNGKPLIPVNAVQSTEGIYMMLLAKGSFIPEREINAGYQIIAKVDVGPVEYVLGEHGGKFPAFVTWERTPANDGNGPPNYYWGHYFQDRSSAIQDFCGRAAEKFEMLSEERKPSIKERLTAKPVHDRRLPARNSKEQEAR